MAGRFPLYTDADVRGPLIEALKSAGWDIARVIDEMVEGTKDPPHDPFAPYPIIRIWPKR